MNYSPDIHIMQRIKNTRDPMCMTDLSLQALACSDRWKEIFGTDDVFSLNDFFHPGIPDLAKSFSESRFWVDVEVEKVFQNETLQNFKLSFYPYFQGADIRGYFCTVKPGEKTAANPQNTDLLHQNFKDAFHGSIIGIAIVSLDGMWMEVNENVCKMTGYTAAELTQLSFRDTMHPDDLNKDPELMEELLVGKIDSYQIERRCYHKDGHIVWMRMAVTLSRDQQGNHRYFVAQIEDVSETRQALETIRENENIFAGIFQSSYQFTALLTPESNIVKINKAALEFFGLTHIGSVGKPFHELPNWDDKDRDKIRTYISRAAAGEYVIVEEKLRDKIGKEVWIGFTLKPVHDNRKVVSIVAEGRIIQEIIDARTKVLESEQKLRSFFDLSPVAFVVNDLATKKFIDFNDSFLYNTGYTREEFLTFDYWKLFPDDYRWMEPIVMEKLEETGVFGPIAIEYMRRDGVRFPILVNGMLTTDRNGNQQIWSVVQDISDLKSKEQELQKLNEEIAAQNVLLSASNDELEQFAYVASHDLQEPLRMITGFLTLLERKYRQGLDDKAREYIHYAVDGAHRMRQVIIDILAYSKTDQDQTERKITDLERVVKNVTQLLSAMISEKQAVIAWKNLPEINGQRAALHQLFSNLLSNAMKYQVPGVPPKITINVVDLGNKWQFCVEDNGIGIAPEAHDRIFQLFKRLNGKRKHQGSGIGLAICKKIVEKHGGSIWVESVPGQGSKFYFTLAK